MSTATRQSDSSATRLDARLRELGLVVAHCNTAGEIIAPVPGDDWLVNLIVRSPLVRKHLAHLASVWDEQDYPQGAAVVPGLWCEPVEIRRRRRRTGYGLVFAPMSGFCDSEQFLAMCHTAELDAQATRRSLEMTGLIPTSEVWRIASMARDQFVDAQRLADDQRTLEGIGQQLAESYEEISLLYTISQSMTVIQHPGKFIRNVCRGVLETLPYTWVGIQFLPEVKSLPLLADKLLLEGRESDPVPERFGVLARRLPTFALADSPVVLDPRAQPEHAEFLPLGDPVLLQPISREGQMVAVLFAAGKRGSDRAASSVDLKLLGATATQTGLFLENAALYEDMDAMFVGTLEAISAAIDAKDPYTCGHSQRVAHLSAELARAVGLDEATIRRVHVAGLVHDVGKIGVPEAVLGKPGRLTEEEFDLIKQHPEIGHRILRDIPQLRDVLPGVLHHHERWDGCGYPHGIAGEEIPLFARLIALADSFDAMSSNRTYRAARNREWVLEEIRTSAGTQFDPALAPVFLDLDFSEFDSMISEHRANDLHTRGKAA